MASKEELALQCRLSETRNTCSRQVILRQLWKLEQRCLAAEELASTKAMAEIDGKVAVVSMPGPLDLAAAPTVASP